MDQEDEYIEFFLNSSATLVQYETLQIFHNAFSKQYFLVRNNSQGITARLETGFLINFEYYPLRITFKETLDNLDYGITIILGELGELLPTEINNVLNSSEYSNAKPILRYRSYRSDNLELPMFGPIELEIEAMNFTKESTTIEAVARRFNQIGTGLRYTIEDFPTLAAALSN